MPVYIFYFLLFNFLNFLHLLVTKDMYFYLLMNKDFYLFISNYLGMTCTVLLRLKSGQLIANQIWEFCHSYDLRQILPLVFSLKYHVTSLLSYQP